MASCKDCIHYEACDVSSVYFGYTVGSEKFREYEKRTDVERDCEQFKDRNRFVDLPCEFLQKCFVIPTIENKLPDITEMKCIGFALSNGSYNANLITDKNKLYQPCFLAFGKTVFLTREEAERALNSTEI